MAHRAETGLVLSHRRYWHATRMPCPTVTGFERLGAANRRIGGLPVEPSAETTLGDKGKR